MAWQYETGASSDRATDYRDLLTKMVAMATSQHVATVAINAAGTGYVVGDILTLTHAGAHLDAKFEVTTVGGSGDITGLRIVSGGAFAIRAASATVSAGGSGYAVGDIIEVQGGTARENAKFEVATLSGSAVATVSLFETGGAYSSTPSNPAATAGVGPAAFAGDDACTLTVTYTSLVGTTGLSVSGGTGSSATVDITLAETGWAVDERNTNDLTVNSLTDEKQVVLVGDASGKTNKPYVGFQTGSVTDGVNDRYFVAIFGMVAHNPLISLQLQPGISNGTPGTFADGGSYLLCDENQVQEMDFWFTMNDQRMGGVVNINPSAVSTDSGEYMHWYAGFMNSFATENEDPYPMLVAASSRATNVNPSSGSTAITGLSECVGPSADSAPVQFYRSEDATWVKVQNSNNLSASTPQEKVMFPIALVPQLSTGTTTYRVVANGPIDFYNTIGRLDRGSATSRLWPVPGSSGLHFPIPLTVLCREGGNSVDLTLDTIRGQLDGFFWVSATDENGATITNFSEDFILIGSDRYRVFHTHVHNQLYHFICIKEDV